MMEALKEKVWMMQWIEIMLIYDYFSGQFGFNSLLEAIKTGWNIRFDTVLSLQCIPCTKGSTYWHLLIISNIQFINATILFLIFSVNFDIFINTPG